MRTVLFHRKYRRFHGGHLKVWNYYNHVLTAPGWDARVHFDPDSSWDRTNPWANERDRVVTSLQDVRADALFVAGRDWQRLDRLGLLDRGLPILNLIQHVRHAEEWSIQSRYLARKAIRICVSQEVADAVEAADSRGPTVVIPNGVDVPRGQEIAADGRPVDLLIAGLKQPVLARRLAEQLGRGRSVELFTEHVPREAFLAAMGRARVSLFLPNEEEGFYLPALEGMALGTLVVCPDCIGNRSFCLDGVNAFRPDYEAGAVADAAETALTLPEDARAAFLATARKTAENHSLEAERNSFHRVLAQLDALWTSH